MNVDRAAKQAEIDSNLIFFQGKLSELLATHPGKYALLRHREIVGIYDTVLDAQTAGQQFYADGLFSVQQITDEPSWLFRAKSWLFLAVESTPMPPRGDFEQQQLDTMRENLKRTPAEIDRSLLFPIVVPKEFARDDWPGPIEPLKSTDLYLTWVVLGANQTMGYANHEAARFWDAGGIDWKAEAQGNLLQSSQTQRYTHHGSITLVALIVSPWGTKMDLGLRDCCFVSSIATSFQTGTA